jgi:GT2 family glycosyltransferase
MVYILIPVHNRIEKTLSCIGCFLKQKFNDFKIIIVDDGSTDGTEKILRAKYPEIIILKGDGNLWWTGAMYKGVKYILSRAKNCDFILSINNDVLFNENYLEILHRTSLRFGRAIVGSLCKNVDKKESIIDPGVKIKWNPFKIYKIGYDKKKKENLDIDTLTGRGTLIPIEVFKKIGNYNKKKLPHYAADHEFIWRAKRAGFNLVLSYKAIVYTDMKSNIFRSNDAIYSYKKYFEKISSIKSPLNIKTQIMFVCLGCPGFFLKLLNIAYVILGNMYLFLRNFILYSLIKIKIIKTKNSCC